MTSRNRLPAEIRTDLAGLNRESLIATAKIALEMAARDRGRTMPTPTEAHLLGQVTNDLDALVARIP